MNSKKAKKIRKFMKDQMGIEPINNKRLYKQVKRSGINAKVLPKTNWKIGEMCKYRFRNDAEREFKIVKINGYNSITGELHLTMIDDKGILINSAYDKERFKI